MSAAFLNAGQILSAPFSLWCNSVCFMLYSWVSIKGLVYGSLVLSFYYMGAYYPIDETFVFLVVCIVSNIVIVHVSLVLMVKVCSLTYPLPEIIWGNGNVYSVAKVV
jgi:hypothetical protein